MGGKALNKFGVFTKRKNTLEFQQIGNELSQKIFIDLELLTSVVKCYHTKADHGDLDLLIKVPYGSIVNWVDYIQNIFTPQAINASGGVYSFDYNDFQIDFIPILEEKWESALVYFSYDPLGNIMGKTFHKFNLSYGWEGLYYKFRNFNGSISANILISNDIKKIFEFGGYDYDKYLKGFETMNDIFQFCINSKYFDAKMFEMENLNNIDRKRNRKRKSYNLFLYYMNNNQIVTQYTFNSDKHYYLHHINSFFPEANLYEKLETLKKEDALKKIISQKFNGDLVMQLLPNLKGKELGAAISKFKKSLGENYDEFILNSNYETIHENFMNVYNDGNK